MAIGIKLTPDTLVLTRGRDFEWTFANLNASEEEIDFPDGDLFFEIYTAETTVWNFVIVGSRASLKVESTATDLIPDRTKWQLVWLPEGEAAGGEVVDLGSVRAQG